MSLNFPLWGFPNFRPNSFYRKPPHILKQKKSISTESENDKIFTEQRISESREFLDIFGIRLYYDDILLISLIFFLYNEGVDDTGLFIALILLLLS